MPFQERTRVTNRPVVGTFFHPHLWTHCACVPTKLSSASTEKATSSIRANQCGHVPRCKIVFHCSASRRSTKKNQFDPVTSEGGGGTFTFCLSIFFFDCLLFTLTVDIHVHDEATKVIFRCILSSIPLHLTTSQRINRQKKNSKRKNAREVFNTLNAFKMIGLQSMGSSRILVLNSRACPFSLDFVR